MYKLLDTQYKVLDFEIQCIACEDRGWMGRFLVAGRWYRNEVV